MGNLLAKFLQKTLCIRIFKYSPQPGYAFIHTHHISGVGREYAVGFGLFDTLLKFYGFRECGWRK